MQLLINIINTIEGSADRGSKPATRTRTKDARPTPVSSLFEHHGQ